MAMSSQQIMAGVAGAAILVLGAYALGRQQAAPEAAAVAAAQASPQSAVPAGTEASPSGPQASSPSASVSLKEPATSPAPRTPVPSPATAQGGQPARSATNAPAPAAAPVCEGCASVVSVHSEVREGQASGLGVVGGAVIGGLLGSQVGGGTGKKIATVGGAVAGGYAGNEIEKRQRSQTVWRVKLRQADGSLRSVELAQDPQVQVGEVVRWRDGRLEKP